MKKFYVLALGTAILFVAGSNQSAFAHAQAATVATHAKPKELAIASAPIPTRVLVQSPADTDAELQIICLFSSDPVNTLHGSLIEMNQKLKGLLERIRQPNLFRGELGETILLAPPAGSLAAKELLIIGLGDAGTFTPERMELVGSIVYRESNRMAIARPFFAPTILDGGVTKFSTGQVSEQFYAGFLRAARTEKLLGQAGASAPQIIQQLTFLAGPVHAEDTKQGIEEAIARSGSK